MVRGRDFGSETVEFIKRRVWMALIFPAFKVMEGIVAVAEYSRGAEVGRKRRHRGDTALSESSTG